jgi:NAD(P)-dependent dehydrogenase (short-subunit alcohol dehydrogenase family)
VTSRPADRRPARLAVVTGAASGLGRAFCRELLRQGGQWRVLAVDIDEAHGQRTIAELRQELGSFAEFHRLDVTDAASWRDLTEGLAVRLDEDERLVPALLVNNAGVCAASEVVGGDAGDWRRLMDVNFFGVLNGCQALGPLFERYAHRDPTVQRRFINVASVAGLLGAPSMGAYCASKAAVVALSEAMYAELRPAGVHVTVVAPGFFRTGLLDSGSLCSPRHRAEAERLSRRAAFTADDVARAAMTASERGRLYCVLGARARWLWRVKRLAPRILHRVIARNYNRTFRGRLQSEPLLD